MPVTLLIFIAGLVLRFGINGYNTLGDILIGLGVGLSALAIIFFGGILAAAWKDIK